MIKTNNLKERIKENFIKNKVLLIVFSIIWVATIAITLSFYGNTLGKQSIGNEGSQNIVEVYKNSSIEEKIKVEDIQDAKSIAIKFATYLRVNKGNINIVVKGDTSNTEYVNKTIDVKTIQDNDFLTLDLAKQLELSKDKSITVTITSDSEKGSCAGVYYSNNKCFTDSTLKINKQVKSGDLSVRFLVENEDLNKFYTSVITWVIVTFTIVILTILLIAPKLETLFLMISIIFGLTFLVIITPMSVPDETTHYEYSFELSNLIMGKEDYRVVDKEYQNYGSFAGHYNISAAYERFVKKINRPLSLDNENVEFNTDIKNFYLTPFIPQAIGVTLARLLNLNMLKTFYMGRLFNLIFYVVCIYLAVKKAPIHKMLFGVIGTLPIFMQQAASFSYDCFINGLSILLFACVLKWMHQEERITIKDFIFVFIVNLLIAPIKVVYGLLSFLFWFVPSEKFGSKRNKIIGTLIITAPAMYEIAVLVFPLAFRAIKKIFENVFLTIKNKTVKTIYANTGDGIEYTYAPNYSEDELYSFSDVLANPLEAIEITLRTIRYNIKIWFYGAFGRTLSGNTLVLPITLVHSLLVFLIALSFRQESFVEPISFKIVSIVLCAFAGLMMLGGLLISWTPISQDVIEAYGGPIIQGVQGRYFSPFLPYCFVLFNNKKIKLNQKFDKYALFIYLILVFEVIVYVLSYTFVN